MVRAASLVVGFVLAVVPTPLRPRAPAFGAPSDEQPAGLTCGECRVTFMKCMVAGKDLRPDERKEYNERCADVAARCYKGCAK